MPVHIVPGNEGFCLVLSVGLHCNKHLRNVAINEPMEYVKLENSLILTEGISIRAAPS